MAAWTSRAAASMLRFKSNCSVMAVEPRPLELVISVTDAMRPNWRSSGVATEEAIVSALAPARVAFTWMVGKSTCGKGETGKIRNATKPAKAMAAVSSVVAMGLRMKGSQIFMRRYLRGCGARTYACSVHTRVNARCLEDEAR